jgi:hypothetical protein
VKLNLFKISEYDDVKNTRRDLLLQSKKLVEIISTVRQWAEKQSVEKEVLSKKKYDRKPMLCLNSFYSIQIADLERRIDLRRSKMLSQLSQIYSIEIEESGKSRKASICGVSVTNCN